MYIVHRELGSNAWRLIRLQAQHVILLFYLQNNATRTTTKYQRKKQLHTGYI